MNHAIYWIVIYPVDSRRYQPFEQPGPAVEACGRKDKNPVLLERKVYYFICRWQN